MRSKVNQSFSILNGILIISKIIWPSIVYTSLSLINYKTENNEKKKSWAIGYYTYFKPNSVNNTKFDF